MACHFPVLEKVNSYKYCTFRYTYMDRICSYLERKQTIKLFTSQYIKICFQNPHRNDFIFLFTRPISNICSSSLQTLYGSVLQKRAKKTTAGMSLSTSSSVAFSQLDTLTLTQLEILLSALLEMKILGQTSQCTARQSSRSSNKSN